MRLLPRTKASPDFRSEVLRRVRAAEEPQPAPFVWRIAAAVAMAACLVAVVQIATLVRHERQREALRVERQQLEAELAAVKEIAREAEPVVVLENDRGTRVILDLDSAVQPAAHRNYD
jgi:hypothetical protein